MTAPLSPPLTISSEGGDIMDHLKRRLLKHSLLFSALAALPGGLSAAPGKQTITDIRGRQIDCRLTPQRIYVADAS